MCCIQVVDLCFCVKDMFCVQEATNANYYSLSVGVSIACLGLRHLLVQEQEAKLKWNLAMLSHEFLANIIIESSCCCQKCNRSSWTWIFVAFGWDFGQIIICLLLCWELKLVGSLAASHCYACWRWWFVSTASKVMTALILVIFSFSFTGTDTMVKPSKFLVWSFLCNLIDMIPMQIFHKSQLTKLWVSPTETAMMDVLREVSRQVQSIVYLPCLSRAVAGILHKGLDIYLGL
jgi:hypothetical protein